MGTFVHCDSNGGNVTAITGVDWGTAAAEALAADLAIMPWVFLNTETPTDPTSEAWTLVTAQVKEDCEARVLHRICDGTEAGAISGWSTTGTGNRQGAVLFVVRGYDGISGFSVRPETVNSTSHECPALTTSDGYGGLFPEDGDTTLVFTFDRAASTAAAPPSGWSIRTSSVFAATGTGGTIVGMADDGLTDASTFPVDPGPWTGQASSDDALTITLSLRPSSTTHSATGDRSATATLAGAASLAKAAVGSLAAVAALTGAATGIKPVLGDLVATVLTTGAASVAKASSGNLSATATLTGAADVLSGVEANGDLTVTAGLTGGALLTRTTAGDLTTTVTLTGASEATRPASGDLSGAAALSGTALLERIATGALSVTASLVGAAEAVVAFEAPEEVTATVRDLSTAATPRAPFTTAAAVPAVSTATARSPE